MITSARLLAFLVSAVAGSGDSSFYFSYNHHGEDWIQGECASRDRQSPIDLPYGAAPWKCTPPVMKFLKHKLGDEFYQKLGYAKLNGEDIPDVPVADDGIVGAAPAAAGSAAMAPAAASSLLELNYSQVPAAPAPAGALPGAPPPFIHPGCGPVDSFFFNYDPAEKPMTIQNNGHTISTDLKGHGLGSINWEGFNFDVLSVNFHVRSEHTFKGKSYPLELHIVHREPETSQILVVAIPFDVPGGPAASLLQNRKRRGCRGLRGRPDLPNEPCVPLDPVEMEAVADADVDQVVKTADLTAAEAAEIAEVHVEGPKEPKSSDPGFCDALQNLISYPLPKEGQSKSVPLRNGPVDLIGPLVSGAGDCSRKSPKEPFYPQAYFQYRGSLTAPPCSEQVTWLVRKDPIFASKTQIELLRVATMESNSNFQNARSVMPLMGRHILYRLAVQGDAPPPPPQPFDPAKPPKERVVDFAGVSAGKDALIRALEAQGAKDMLAEGVAQAQQNFAGAGAMVNPGVAAHMMGGAPLDALMTTPLPTPNPQRVLSRIVDAVAQQMDGAEKAAALAAAGVR